MSDQTLREALGKLEVPSMVVWVDKEMKVETTNLTLETIDQILALLQTAIRETEKAYGGCHKCYGKGYATVRKGTTYMGKTTNLKTHLSFCTCDRGKQLAALTKKEASDEE